MNILNDMMHELMQKIKSKLSLNSQNWLENRVSNKNPKKFNHLLFLMIPPICNQ